MTGPVEPAAALAPDGGSFRDRSGAVYTGAAGILRGLDETALAHWRTLAATDFYRAASVAGRIVETELSDCARLPAGHGWAACLRHARIPFVSYPYEWPFGMLRDGALLTLDLLVGALDEGMILKDASAFNVQWRGPRPVFIDIPSFEAYAPGAAWAGYRQFCEMFLYPLMLMAYKGFFPGGLLRGRVDGLPVADAARLLGSWRDRLRPGVFTHVWLQDRFQRRYAGRDVQVSEKLKSVRFDARMIRHNALALRRRVAGLELGQGDSAWTTYAETHSYGEQIEAKAAFVREFAARRRWTLAWDIGCNTGRFSRILADHADAVVAMDADPLVVEQVYRAEREYADSPVVPLVIDIADASPGLGWRGRERRRLEARGRPELVLNLALIHHIVIGANIPLREYLDWLAETAHTVLVEFVDKSDEMVQRLLRNRVDQYDDYTRENFERELRARFDVLDVKETKAGSRWLYAGAVRR